MGFRDDEGAQRARADVLQRELDEEKAKHAEELQAAQEKIESLKQRLAGKKKAETSRLVPPVIAVVVLVLGAAGAVIFIATSAKQAPKTRHVAVANAPAAVPDAALPRAAAVGVRVKVGQTVKVPLPRPPKELGIEDASIASMTYHGHAMVTGLRPGKTRIIGREFTKLPIIIPVTVTR